MKEVNMKKHLGDREVSIRKDPCDGYVECASDDSIKACANDKMSELSHAVVWSGGLDSTLILIDLIKRGVQPTVLTFTCDTFGGLHHQEFEKSARTEILKYIAKEYSYEIPMADNISMNYSNIGIGHNVFGKDGGIVQQPYMLSMLSIFSPNNTCYHMGYHKGDDFWTYSYDIISAHKHLLAVTGNKNVELSFPLQHMTKADIIRKLQGYKFPIELCSYCYSPEYSGPCGSCAACETYRKAMQEIAISKSLESDIVYKHGLLPKE